MNAREWFAGMIVKPEGMENDFFNTKIDEYLSHHAASVAEIETMLASKPTSVAAFKRAMTEGSTWQASFLFSAPSFKTAARTVRKVRSADVVFANETGASTYLTLSGDKVFAAADGSFFVLVTDGMGTTGYRPNVVKYAPAR